MKRIEQFEEVIDLFKRLGEEKSRVLLDKRNREKVVDFCTDLLKNQEYPIFLNRNQSLKEIISAGCYGWFDRRINSKNCSFSGKGNVSRNLKFVCLGQSVDNETISSFFERKRIRKATTEEFLVFGASYLEMGLEFPIVCLNPLKIKNKKYLLLLINSSSAFNRKLLLVPETAFCDHKTKWRYDSHFLASS